MKHAIQTYLSREDSTAGFLMKRTQIKYLAENLLNPKLPDRERTELTEQLRMESLDLFEIMETFTHELGELTNAADSAIHLAIQQG